MFQQVNDMHQVCFQNSAWYQALPLTERIASLQTVDPEALSVNIDRELALRRMQRWKSQSPFSAEVDFAQRLALDSITEQAFLNFLGESMEALQNRLAHPPTWLAAIKQAFTGSTATLPLLFALERPQEQKTDGFLYLIEPLLSQGCEQLWQELELLIQSQSELPFDPNTVIDLLLPSLLEQLLEMVSRTMVLELNVARLQGLLQGDTPEERFQSFLEQLQDHNYTIALLQEYPVLARQIVLCIRHWITFSLEFIQHLCDDWCDIQTLFSPECYPGQLSVIEGGAGDRHRSGHSVLILQFTSGLRLVYKPRSLAVDIHFQELLIWLNQRGDHPPFQTLTILDRNSYGWIEFVNARGCTTVEEVQHFYQRQGGYLALLYALAATDFHNENLIASGEHPILVDLEALFHPHFQSVDPTQLDQLISKEMMDSVLSIGLLPQRMWANTESEGIDISGLSSTIGQLTPYQAPNWEEVGTDEMRLIRTRVELSGNQNRPTLNGVEINLLDYTESLLAGFINIYQLLLDRRDELLDKNGLIERFTKDEVRVIFRSTLDYNWLLAESFHPHVLQNALERDRLFDHLWEEVKQQSYLTKVIAFEQNDLWQGDIPIFTTYPGSRSIWNSSYEQVADFFNESGMELVKRRFQQLSEQNLRRQLWFIRASLTTSITVEEPIQWPSYSPIEPANCINRQLLLTAAQLVGARLEALALCNGQEASWIGLTLLNEKHWTLSALGFDLYDGIPGVTLFLAYLGATTHQNRYTVLAKAALATLQRQLDTSHESIVSIGGFQGWGGIIYLLTQLGILWNEPALLDQAESLVKRLPVLILKDRELDIIGGTAGCLGSLMSLYCCRPAQSILTAAIQCGDHLIAQAQTMPQGIGWFPKGGKSQPLAGFAHGVAGITWALLQLSVLTADTRFRAAAIAGIAYERSIFCPSNGNWFDTHSFADTVLTGSSSLSSGRTAWCHGTPGIGLARLCSLPHFNDAEIQAEIDTALKNTLENGFCGNHSLCHGDLGNLELLLQASQSFGSITWQKHVDRLSATILESIDQHGWLCGVPMGVETPGLMTGLAGIGYELLRLAEPGRVPSVLNLAPPIANV